MKSIHIRIACGFLIFFIVACASNQLNIKKQEEASRKVGEEYMRLKDYTSALREFLNAEKLYPKDPILQNDLGLIYMAKGKLDLAASRFKKAINLKSDYSEAGNNLGTIYLYQGKWDAAIKAFNKITDDLLYVTPHFPLSNLGWAYYHKKDYRKAIKFFNDTLKIKPGFIKAMRGLGLTYSATGRISESIAILKKAIEYAPRAPEIYLDLGRSYVLMGKYTKAMKAFYKVVEIAPGTAISETAKNEADRLGN